MPRFVDAWRRRVSFAFASIGTITVWWLVSGDCGARLPEQMRHFQHLHAEVPPPTKEEIWLPQPILHQFGWCMVDTGAGHFEETGILVGSYTPQPVAYPFVVIDPFARGPTCMAPGDPSFDYGFPTFRLHVPPWSDARWVHPTVQATRQRVAVSLLETWAVAPTGPQVAALFHSGVAERIHELDVCTPQPKFGRMPEGRRIALELEIRPGRRTFTAHSSLIVGVTACMARVAERWVVPSALFGLVRRSTYAAARIVLRMADEGGVSNR